MLTAMTAVENLLEGRTSKENLWAVNAEQQYHEEQRDAGTHVTHRVADSLDREEKATTTEEIGAGA
jgi:hypothetical protein